MSENEVKIDEYSEQAEKYRNLIRLAMHPTILTQAEFITDFIASGGNYWCFTPKELLVFIDLLSNNTISLLHNAGLPLSDAQIDILNMEYHLK